MASPVAVGKISLRGRKSETPRLAGFELRIGGNFDGHELSALIGVVKFPAVTAPARVKGQHYGSLVVRPTRFRVSCAPLEFRSQEGWPGPTLAAGADFGHPAADHIVAPLA